MRRADRRDVLRDAESLRELAIAQTVLEVRGRSHPNAERSATAVLARVRADRRRRWFRRVGGLAAAAAAAWYWLMLPPADLRWGPVEVVTAAARGATELSFRVEVVPTVASYTGLWVVTGGAEPVVRQLHPVPAAVAATPAYAGWPNGQWLAGRSVRLPPVGIEPFRVPAADGLLVLVQASEPLADRLGQLTASLEAAVADPAVARAPLQVMAALQQPGLTVAVQRLRAR